MYKRQLRELSQPIDGRGEGCDPRLHVGDLCGDVVGGDHPSGDRAQPCKPCLLYTSLGEAVGTKLYSLSGDVLHEGLHELPMGTSLRELVFGCGGGMLAGKGFKAVFTGGPSNTLLTDRDLDMALDFDSLSARGSRLGTGAMIVVGEGTSILRKTAEYVAFFAANSCGQCPSCKIGTHQVSRLLERIDAGAGRPSDLEALENFTRLLPGSGRCGLVDGCLLYTSRCV